MKVKDKREKIYCVDEIEVGSVFEYNGEFFMVMVHGESSDYETLVVDYETLVVNLKNGYTERYKWGTKVELVEGEFVCQ